MKGRRQKGRPSDGEATPSAGSEELPERWSVQRKTELVLPDDVHHGLAEPQRVAARGRPRRRVREPTQSVSTPAAHSRRRVPRKSGSTRPRPDRPRRRSYRKLGDPLSHSS